MTLLQHAFLAILIQLVLRLAAGNWWSGAAVASAYFVGREVAQAEYRWIEWFGGGLRANMPWWGPFDLRVWPKLDQWMDWIGPIVVTCSIAAVMAARRRR
ncbi:hypothetical protein [Novosphingobium sp. ZW T3_23]|uniref:hypothetical protein n=1 Tax=Novosphingobium sp. ZW T3_23 TaxID=3378084 RepID=UPI00385498AF